MPLANRATIGNMSPEYGSTAAIFPIDDETLRYLRFTGRPDEQVALVEAYAKTNGLWHDPSDEPVFSETLELDLSTVEPSIAGPKRPQDRVRLADAKQPFRAALGDYVAGRRGPATSIDESIAETFPASDPASPVADGADVHIDSAAPDAHGRVSQPDADHARRRHDGVVDHGAVAIAAITSCTNTSNPSVMIGGGPARQERGREGPAQQALGQDDAGARARRSSPTTTSGPA